jgi:hypothetical protein
MPFTCQRSVSGCLFVEKVEVVQLIVSRTFGRLRQWAIEQSLSKDSQTSESRKIILTGLDNNCAILYRIHRRTSVCPIDQICQPSDSTIPVELSPIRSATPPHSHLPP